MTLKLIKPTLIFYAIAAVTIILLEKLSPSGPCTPGLGVLSFFLLIPVSAGLLLRSVFLTFSKDKAYIGVASLHIIAIILLLVIMW